ncbi:MAG TPA: hypothetical protein PLP91_10725, partial [Plasticicumulans sp.]|nr:hypothetical protein [Plasticicumulans sp.]
YLKKPVWHSGSYTFSAGTVCGGWRVLPMVERGRGDAVAGSMLSSPSSATSTGPMPTCWWPAPVQAALAKPSGAGGDVGGPAAL